MNPRKGDAATPFEARCGGSSGKVQTTDSKTPWADECAGEVSVTGTDKSHMVTFPDQGPRTQIMGFRA